MVCKFCNAEIEENQRVCPACGKMLETEEAQIIDSPETEQITDSQATEQIADSPETEQTTDSSETEKKPKKGVWKLVLLIVGFAAALCVLAVILLREFDVELFPKEDIYRKDTYTAEQEKVVDKADTVVATVGTAKLDNALLQVFYVEEFEAFYSQYYSYISLLGLDLTKPLSEQTCYFDKAMTWEQFMLQAGIESWQRYVLLGNMADEAGYVLDAQLQQTLDKLPQTLEEDAKKNNYESADALLKERYGENCSMAVYMEYVSLVFKANSFYASAFDVTDDEIEAEFAAHEAEFAEKGITRTSALVSDVRHILISPEGGTKGEDGKTTYSEQEWAACLAEAEKVLDEWKAGEATVDTFQELVTKYTDDTASKSTGGLYEGIANDGSYMKEFQDWAIDTNRTPGETGLVKTDYGYHIMYFVEGEPEWIYYSRKQIQDARFNELQEKMNERMEKNPAKIKYSKIVLQDIYE